MNTVRDNREPWEKGPPISSGCVWCDGGAVGFMDGYGKRYHSVETKVFKCGRVAKDTSPEYMRMPLCTYTIDRSRPIFDMSDAD